MGMDNNIEWETIRCPLCNSANYESWREVPDRFDTLPDQTFSIVNCTDCGFRYLNPRPAEDSIHPFYAHEEYDPFLSTRESYSVQDVLYRLARYYSLWRKRLAVEDFVRGGRLLDVGCGTGEFLHYMNRFQWSVAGVEPDVKSRAHAEAQGISVYPSLWDVAAERFDLITLWHVIEHLHDLNRAVRKLESLVRPDGVLVLAMPNVHSWDFQRYQEHWVALDTPRHVYHFTGMDIKKLFAETSFRLKDTGALTLDTVYNVLYSEQLRHRREGKRYRPFYMINSMFGSLVHNRQTNHTSGSASVYYLVKEKEHA